MWSSCLGEGSVGWPQEYCHQMSLIFTLYVLLIDFSPSKKFQDMFAFGAPKVIGHFITTLMITYANKVIISCMDLTSCVPSHASGLGQHTSVLFIHNKNPGEGTIQVAWYIWEHDTQRPNTHIHPVSCSVCHRVQSWTTPNIVRWAGGDVFTLQCLTK